MFRLGCSCATVPLKLKLQFTSSQVHKFTSHLEVQALREAQRPGEQVRHHAKGGGPHAEAVVDGHPLPRRTGVQAVRVRK